MKRFYVGLTFLLLMVCCSVIAQENDAFNYQAMVRKVDGTIVSNQQIEAIISIESDDAINLYSEKHSLETDVYGVINLSVGNGDLLSGIWDEIDWSGNLNLKVEIDYDRDGTIDLDGLNLIAIVPKAYFAKKANVADRLSSDLSGVASSGDFNDLKNKPKLELNENRLSIEGGNTVSLSSLNLADKPQELSLSGNDLKISLGNSVNLSSVNTDSQALAINGDRLTISNGNTVILPVEGDMFKSVYDTDDNGEVDKAENAGRVNNLTVQTAVPLSAVFSDDQTLNEVLTEGNDAGGRKITSLGTPTNPDDAVTKEYVDDELLGKADKQTGMGLSSNDFTDAEKSRLANDVELVANKNTANGYAGLDGNRKIDTSQLPAITLNNVYTSDSEAEQLALSVSTGDVVIRTDIKKNFVHNGGTSGSMADWTELLSPDIDVESVNGKTGIVTIGIADIPSLQDEIDEKATITYVDATVNNARLTEAEVDAYVGNNGYLTSESDDQTLYEVLTEGNDAGGTRLTGLGTPINPNDAATKKYIDDGLRDKVDKQSGMGLSSNDFTDAEKSRLAYDVELGANKNVADGYAGLDGNRKIDASQLPAITLNNVYTKDSEAAHLALFAKEGDVVIRTDIKKNFVHNGSNLGGMANWTELLSPDIDVESVNGKTGIVTIGIADISNLQGELDEKATIAYVDSKSVELVNDFSGGSNKALSAEMGKELKSQVDTKAPLASPVFTGFPQLPSGTTGITQSAGDHSDKLATTAYVDVAIQNSELTVINDLTTGGTSVALSAEQGKVLQTNKLETSATFGGDISGTYNSIDLEAGVVGNTELATDAVDASKIATDAVESDEIKDGTIAAADLSQMSATDGQVLKWNNTSSTWVASDDNNSQVTVVDDLTTGGTSDALSAEQGKILQTNKLETSATFGGDVSGTYNSIDLEAGVVGNTELATDAIDASKIATDAVESDEIKDGTIAAADLSQMSATDGQVMKWDVIANAGAGGWVASDDNNTGWDYKLGNNTIRNDSETAGGISISATGDVTTGRLNVVSDTNPAFHVDGSTVDITFPSNENLQFGTLNGTTATERMTLSNSGNLAVDGDITVRGGRITGASSEYIRIGEVNGEIEFQGAGGSNNTDLKIDLDGSMPVISSPTDTHVGIDDHLKLETGKNMVFEGSTANAHETTLQVANPTLDRTITLPNKTGTVALTSDIQTNTDDQKIDVLSLSGSTLNISLEGDGEATRTLNLSAINTDTQNLSLSGNTLSLTNGGNVNLAAYMDNTDTQWDYKLGNNTIRNNTETAGGISISATGDVTTGRLSVVSSSNPALHVDGSTVDITFPSNESLQFGTLNGTTATERMTLSNNGNLTIDGDITVSGGRITGSSSEYIRIGEVNGEIEFQGTGGSNNTDLKIDLDGTMPVISSPTDTHVGIDDHLKLEAGKNMVFEGATANAHETTLQVTNPTADRTITLPNKTGTVALTSDIQTNTDDQKIDVLSLTGSTLNISLEGDGEATKTLNLSGVNTDTQNLSLSGNTLSLTNGGSVNLSAFKDNTDNQSLSVSSGASNVSNIHLTNGGIVQLMAGSNISLTESGNAITIAATAANDNLGNHIATTHIDLSNEAYWINGDGSDNKGMTVQNDGDVKVSSGLIFEKGTYDIKLQGAATSGSHKFITFPNKSGNVVVTDAFGNVSMQNNTGDVKLEFNFANDSPVIEVTEDHPNYNRLALDGWLAVNSDASISSLGGGWYPFSVHGSKNHGTVSGNYKKWGQWASYHDYYSGRPQISAYFQSHAISDAGFLVSSDERIKRFIGHSDSGLDLEKITQIQIVDYQYIDTISKGNRIQKKVIAQQVKKILPSAVSESINVIPSIMQGADSHVVEDKLITIPLKHDSISKGDTLKIIYENYNPNGEITETKTDYIVVKEYKDDSLSYESTQIDFVNDQTFIFVYGHKVEDFLTVDYDALAMLNVSATQEIYRQLQEQKENSAKLITELQKQNTQLQEDLTALVRDHKNRQQQFAEVSKENDLLKNKFEELETKLNALLLQNQLVTTE